MLLKLAIEERCQKKTLNSLRLEKLIENNRKRKNQLPFFKTNVDGYINNVAFHRENFVALSKSHLCRQNEVKIIVKRRIEQLLTYIFPITHVKGSL